MALCGFRVPFRICLYSKALGKTTGGKTNEGLELVLVPFGGPFITHSWHYQDIL